MRIEEVAIAWHALSPMEYNGLRTERKRKKEKGKTTVRFSFSFFPVSFCPLQGRNNYSLDRRVEGKTFIAQTSLNGGPSMTPAQNVEI